jgi:hypothetical protein
MDRPGRSLDAREERGETRWAQDTLTFVLPTAHAEQPSPAETKR